MLKRPRREALESEEKTRRGGKKGARRRNEEERKNDKKKRGKEGGRENSLQKGKIEKGGEWTLKLTSNGKSRSP